MDFEGKKVNLKARVLDTSIFASSELKEGDIVILTRDCRESHGDIATDIAGTFGVIGVEYELI